MSTADVVAGGAGGAAVGAGGGFLIAGPPGALIGGGLGAIGGGAAGASNKKDVEQPDNSPAMIAMAQQSAAAQMHASDNQYQLGMAQVGAQMIQAQGMYNLGQAQINAQRDLASERNQTSLDIARLNYLQQAKAQEDRHAERMGEIDLRRYEVDHPAEALGL